MAVEEVGIKLNLAGRAEAAKGLKDTDADIARLGTTAEASGSKLREGLGAVEAGGRKVAAGVKVVTLAVGATATAAALSLVKVGVSYNNLEQTSRAAMTTLLGSRDAANAMMDSVREFGKTSPFPRQAFISATQQLLGFGFTADSIIPTLKTINDTTAALGGNAETVSTLSDVFASIKAQGKLSGDQVQRLSAIGVNAIDILGQASGKSAAQVQKAISSGAVKADAAIAILTNGMNKRFGGAADNVKNTWSGATDRIAGAWRDLGSDLVAPFVDPNGGGYAVVWANQIADLLRRVQGQVPGVILKLQTGAAAARNGGTGGMASTWERIGFQIGRVQILLAGYDWAGLMRRVRGAFASGSVGGFFSTLVGDGPKARSQLSGISESLHKLSPAFKAFADAAPSLSSVLTVLGGALGFLARHVDTLVKIMPFLVGAYIAYRATLSTAAVVTKVMREQQLLTTLTNWRQIGATKALARSNLELAAAMRAQTGATTQSTTATNAGALANARAALKAGAMRVATLAQTAATKLARVAMIGFNAVMDANPIALVVLGIVALAAGAIYAYKHFEWFRDAVDATWGALKTAGKWLWDTVAPFTPLGLAIQGGIALVKEIKGHWSDFVDVLKSGAKWLGKVADAMGLGHFSKLMSNTFGGGGDTVAAPQARASGGPVVAGQPYIVGEQRPELFVPHTSGTIVPRVPTQGGQRVAAAANVATATGSGDLTVNLVVAEQVLGTVVLQDFRNRAARQ